MKTNLQSISTSNFHQTMTASIETMLSCIDIESTKTAKHFMYTSPTAEDTFSYCLESFGRAVTASVFKRLTGGSIPKNPDSNGTYDETVANVRAEFMHDIVLEESKRIAGMIAYGTRYNANGNAERTIEDAHAVEVLKENTSDGYLDGLDIYHESMLAIMETLLSMIISDEQIDFEKPVTKTVLKRRVFKIGYELTADDYTETETVPVKEVFKATRRAIEANKNVRAVLSGNVYIEDTESANEKLYRYFGKYADVGGYDCSNLYTGDAETMQAIYFSIKDMHLTDRQNTVLTYRLQGLSVEQIAERMNVTKRAVQKHIEYIRKKANTAMQEQAEKAEQAERKECEKIAEEIAYMAMHGRTAKR